MTAKPLIDRARMLKPFQGYPELANTGVLGDTLLGINSLYGKLGLEAAAKIAGISKRNHDFRERYFKQQKIPKGKAEEMLEKAVSYAEEIQSGNQGNDAPEPETDEPVSSENEKPPPALMPLPDGATRPCFHVLWGWLSVEGREKKLQPGLYFCDDGEDERISAPIEVVSVSTDIETNATLITVKFRHHYTNVEITQAVDLADTATDSRSVVRSLATAGLIDIEAAPLLMRYLQSLKVDVTRSVSRTGWASDDCFVMAGDTIGGSDLVYSGTDTGLNTCGGSIEGWKRDVCGLISNNPMSIAALSASFAGAILEPLRANTFGVHLHGKSSIGKTSTLEAAASVWGQPETMTATWAASDSGIEGLAYSRNSMCLCLDEIGQTDPGKVGGMIYALGNGTGKARSGVDGKSSTVNRWRETFISTGEMSVRQLMSAAGKLSMSGHDVRLLNIKAHRGKAGAWDDTHGMTGAGMSEALKTAARTHYGHAGRLFVEHLIKTTPNYQRRLQETQAQFPSDGYSGIADRAARQFAIIALAGEIATEAGITGWPAGHATECAVLLFNEWMDAQPAPEPDGETVARLVASYVDGNRDDLLIRSKADVDSFKAAGLMIETKGDDILSVFVRGETLSDVADMSAQRAAKKLDDACFLFNKTDGYQAQVKLQRKKVAAYRLDWKRLCPLLDP